MATVTFKAHVDESRFNPAKPDNDLREIVMHFEGLSGQDERLLNVHFNTYVGSSLIAYKDNQNGEASGCLTAIVNSTDVAKAALNFAIEGAECIETPTQARAELLAATTNFNSLGVQHGWH